MDEDYTETAVIVYPTSWPEQDAESHCTIIYLGEVAELPYSIHDVKNVVDSFLWPKEIMAATDGLDFFGPEQNIPVVRLLGENLQRNRELLKLELNAAGIFWEETYPEYKPHVTINPIEVLSSDHYREFLMEGFYGDVIRAKNSILQRYAEVPDSIGLHRPEIWWGNEHY